MALFSYVGWVGKFFTRHGKAKETDEFLETLGNFLGHYVNNRLGKWIQQNDGWVGIWYRYNGLLVYFNFAAKFSSQIK